MNWEHSKAIAELNRKLENILRIGRVCEADYGKARVRVESGEVTTGWLPWITTRASSDVSWWAPEVGEQVMLLSPSGDLAQAAVLPSLFQVAHPACADRPTIERKVYEDGAVIEYDREAHLLHAYIPGDAFFEVDHDVTVIAGNDISATAKGGNINVTADFGEITVLAKSDNVNVIAEKADINMTATEGKITCRAKDEIALISEDKIRQSAPKLVMDGIIENGGGQYGGGGKIYGPIEQAGGDFVSDGVSLQHHTHNENGDVTNEPNGGTSES
ncbi:phage baseplate assembly protein V [Maridesulfovibrio hydrothermalis]|uniref:Phage baseplate assembly protein V n=1 Tax=Maridesulfovibrio hydrothermalis AM13 = DSM 14728 TaxID=1121451 RepID=L0R7Q0_9BACT|nr:phage baseplate assembly protein V [Maridesulfovibrio hydrothermalis]CCO22220.1 Phage baseplate assembly protein V [Maridesulfovibrio hydrothermalis AM13 = DSM 14728]